MWATQRLLDAIRDFDSASLTRDFGTADKSVLGTLYHIYLADSVWLERVGGRRFPGRTPADQQSLQHLESMWVPVLEEWKCWLETQPDPNRVIAYQDMSGRDWQNTISEIILHLVNHATHHRGQVSGFLRALGKVPPQLDLIAYYRGR